MRVLVTGGAGYIGSHAAKALAEAGHEPVVFDSLRTGHRWAVQWGPFVHGDIRDVLLLAETMRAHAIDAVMHFAALADVPTAVAQPGLCWDINVTGTLALLSAMKLTGVDKIVFSSTCAVYGPSDDVPMTEATAQNPISPYGHSKRAMEQIIAEHAAAYGFGGVALRYFNVAGADPDGDIGEEHAPETHLIPVVLEAAAGARPFIAINGDDYPTNDGTCVRDYVHVADLAKAHVAALSTIDGGTVAAFNLGTGHGYSVKEVIEAAERVTGRTIPVRNGPRREGDPARLTADASAAQAKLAFDPNASALDTMIASTWRWMVEHRTGVRLPSMLDRGNRNRSI
ncbi:MAG: UDP-glucose 4-epimerase GalE [Pseudomonadota bacterium]